MKARVAIVGAGALGARHLQALCSLERRLDIAVVDPSDNAQRHAIEIYERSSPKADARVLRLQAVSQLPWTPDVSIVATASRERRDVLENLVQRGARQFVLEKVLFTRLADFDAVDVLFSRHNVRAWVNCARRAWPRAQELMALVGGRKFRYRVAGTGWGLASNFIHHADEAAMLDGRADIAISGEGLRPGSIASKRAGYIEFVGTLTGVFGGGSTVTAVCNEGPTDSRTVTIEMDDLSLVLSQSDQTLTVTSGGHSRSEPYPMPFQSQLTDRYVATILDGEDPHLPDYETAARLHRPMIAAFLDHLRTSSGDPTIDECPIT